MNPPREDSPDGRIHIEGLKPADIALLRDVAEQAAKLAVNQTLTAMGLNPDEPFHAQKDMMWLRATRERCESAGAKAMITIIGLMVASGAVAFWAGFKSLVTK